MRRSSSLFLVVATTFRGFFQPGHPFVLQQQQQPRQQLVSSKLDAVTICGIDTDCDCNVSSHDTCEGNSYDQSQESVTSRREYLANMAWVATVPALWAFPEIASAASSSGNSDSDRSIKPRDRPVDVELSAAVQKLFDLDEPNRLVPGKDYAIDVQGRNTKSDNENNNGSDAAPDPLFRYVDPAVFEERPTYRTFVALLDNYQPNVCLEEDNTRDETEEAHAFLRACMATPVLKYCYSYCKSKLLLLLLAEQGREQQEEVSSTSEETKASKVNPAQKYSFDTEEDFVQLLYKIWFQLYSRSKGCDNNSSGSSSNDGNGDENRTGPKGKRSKKVYGSSGFEHVFVGEIRKSKVIGFHNWIQFYRQEQAGKLDYRGTIRNSGIGTSGTTPLLTYNLRWKGAEKPVGSSLLGVSPEFELALYTMVFLLGSTNDNILLLNLGDANQHFDRDASSNGETNHVLTKLDVKCFRTKGRVGSCYVESLAS